jgi:hypothetical protein
MHKNVKLKKNAFCYFLQWEGGNPFKVWHDANVISVCIHPLVKTFSLNWFISTGKWDKITNIANSRFVLSNWTHVYQHLPSFFGQCQFESTLSRTICRKHFFWDFKREILLFPTIAIYLTQQILKTYFWF